MEYKKGFEIKPIEIQTDGTVLFTDGTDSVHANQIACEAYGYKYDTATGTCIAFVPNINLESDLSNLTNKKQGEKNTIQEGSHNTSVVGKKNTVYGENENCFISGEQNEITSEINNASVIGKMGKVTHEGEFCVGGGGFNSEAGLLQMSVIQLSRRTTDASDVVLYVDGDADADNDSQILLPANSVVTYEIWLSALVTGGSSGTAGDYEAYVFLGVIRTANDGTMAHNAKIDRLLGRTGSLGTQTIDTSTAYTLSLQVAGLANVNIQYHAVVKLHINKTNVVEI